MGKGFFHVPPAVNEPIKSYAPGSPEREEVLNTYKELYNSTVEVPCYINGKEVKLNQLIEVANDWFNSNNHNKVVDSKSLKKELRDRGKFIRRSDSKYYLQNHKLN